MWEVKVVSLAKDGYSESQQIRLSLTKDSSSSMNLFQ